MVFRTEILARNDEISYKDGRALQIEQKLEAMGHKNATVYIADVYTSECEHPAAFIESLSNPVTQQANNKDLPQFSWALEIGFLPGVTDNVGHTAFELMSFIKPTNENAIYSSQLYYINGNLNHSDVEALAEQLHNPLIQFARIKTFEGYKSDSGMDANIPKVSLDNKGSVADDVDLNISDEELEELGTKGILNADGSRRGPLGLSLLYLKAIQAYFKKEDRKPTDIEVETLAQTWSEHCKHTIFASPIDDIKDGLYKHYIKRATKEIREGKGENDFCVSVFSDNAGAIEFDENWLITDKVETHNSPSALDPFGGSITGIVGVNRDCIGFGMGAKPVINRYGFCVADPREEVQYYRNKDCTNAVLSPKTILQGVVDGVEAGGNQSGIPTPQGFVVFDQRFIGKPLVFVGTIGLIPREINNEPSHIKEAKPNDKIVMIGGRVGRDGIHGATFSSVALDEGSPATAVQIGDPITQKKLSDAIIKEIRDLGLYNSITDNGAGGLSSSVGEMAEQSGGFELELDQVPLKYPGMAPWEIWISESQERMTLSVPEENIDKLFEILIRRGVEASVIGTYTNSGRAVIKWQGKPIMDMEMDFLHDGIPETPLKTTFTRGGKEEPKLPSDLNLKETILNLLSRPNIASTEFITTQYDHNVQGSAVLGPLQGPGRVQACASVTKPVIYSPKGVVLSQGLFPRYSDIDTHDMARAGLDMAVRSAIAAGCSFYNLALLDNICWCSSDEPERLGQLKRAIQGIYHLAKSYGTPFISGKDSMFNDFKGYDSNGDPVKISAPPTLLTSSIGVIENIDQSIPIAPKAVGDLVYILGETKDECGASELYDMLGHLGNNVPEVHDETNKMLYKSYHKAAREKLIASAFPVSYGGLGIALAKKAISGQLGMDITLNTDTIIASDAGLTKTLFSESTGRILVTVAPQNKKKFEKTFSRNYFKHIGHIAYTEKLHIKSQDNDDIELGLSELEEHYKNPLNKSMNSNYIAYNHNFQGEKKND